MPEPEVEGPVAALRTLARSSRERSGLDPFETPESIEPRFLAALAARLGGVAGRARTGTVAPHWPPRPSAEVFAALASGGDVAAVEIGRLLADRAWWGAMRDGRRLVVPGGDIWGATGAAIKLWESSARHPLLRAELRWGVGKALAGAPTDLAPEIIGNLRYAPPEDRTLLIILRDRDAHALAQLAARSGLGPRELLSRRGVPSRLPVASHAGMLAVGMFLADVGRLQAWLIRCLGELSTEDRDHAVDELLGSLTDADASRLPALRAALHEWYVSSGLVQGRLSVQGSVKIAAWSGLFRWDTFLRFAEQRFGRRLDDLPYLWSLGPDAPAADLAAKRAIGRIVVWRNYAARILGLRLYVPDRGEVAQFLSIPGASPDLVEHRPGVRLRLMVVVGPLLVDVPLDDREPIRCAKVPKGATHSFAAARAAVGDNPHVELEIAGYGWQSRLYYGLQEWGILPNDGLVAFEGVPRGGLGRDGMPTFVSEEEAKPRFTAKKTRGKEKWSSPKKKR